VSQWAGQPEPCPIQQTHNNRIWCPVRNAIPQTPNLNQPPFQLLPSFKTNLNRVLNRTSRSVKTSSPKFWSWLLCKIFWEFSSFDFEFEHSSLAELALENFLLIWVLSGAFWLYLRVSVKFFASRFSRRTSLFWELFLRFSSLGILLKDLICFP
jgi:hypothetical protein